MMKVETEDLVVSTVGNIMRFKNVVLEINNDNSLLIIYEGNESLIVFPLCNVLYFNYYVKKGD